VDNESHHTERDAAAAAREAARGRKRRFLGEVR
jgi:hypothetical protein